MQPEESSKGYPRNCARVIPLICARAIDFNSQSIASYTVQNKRLRSLEWNGNENSALKRQFYKPADTFDYKCQS
jgi:hypothetical protein